MRSAVARLAMGLKSGVEPLRKAVTRISRSRSLALMARLATETAMRSMISDRPMVARVATAQKAQTGTQRLKMSVRSKRRTENGSHFARRTDWPTRLQERMG